MVPIRGIAGRRVKLPVFKSSVIPCSDALLVFIGKAALLPRRAARQIYFGAFRRRYESPLDSMRFSVRFTAAPSFACLSACPALLATFAALLSGTPAAAQNVVVPSGLTNVNGNGSNIFPFGLLSNDSQRYQQ